VPLAGALLILPALLAGAACKATPSSPGADAITIAEMNGEPLTLDEAMNSFLSSHTGHGVLVQGEAAVRELAARLVERSLLLEEAEVLGVREDERVITVVDEYRMRLAEQAFWEREVLDPVHVTDEEVEAFYEKTDMAVGLTLIEVEEREAAEALLERVRGGEDMGELARENSTHSSRTFDGSLAFVRRGELEPTLEAEVFVLEEPGSLTPVVATEKGFAFARLDERVTNPMRPDRSVAIPQIRAVLKSRQEKELRAAVEERTRVEAGVEVNETELTVERLLAEGGGDLVVARSAGAELTLDDVRVQLNLDAVRTAPVEMVEDALREMAGAWADRRAVRLAVEGSGLLEKPDVVAKTAKFEDDAVLTTLYRDFMYMGIEVDEEGVRAYYDANLETKYTRPTEVRLAYAVLETEEGAEALLQRAREGEEFGDLAREQSVDPTAAAHGGRIGWVKPGSILPEVEEVAFALSPGDLGGPIETEVGFFALQVIERRESESVPFELAREAARDGALEARQQEAYRVWADRLRERADIRFPEEGIQLAVAWLDEEAERRREEAAAELEAMGGAPDPSMVGPAMPGMPGMPGMPAMPGGHGAVEGGP
jgi:parvulin-like peptidyl-prolyl isomerase